jgi:uncharacterized protein with HEPN domain
MPFRNWQTRIDDILEAIDKIERYTYDFDFDAWQNDEKTIDAVIRNLEIIGEASSHLPIEIQEQYEDVPWGMMKGIRNILAHEYFGVDLEILWKTIKEDLPNLKKRLL